MADELVWEDPPPNTNGGQVGQGPWQSLAAKLAEHPGKWARVHAAVSVRRSESTRASLVKAGCEVARRHNGDQTYSVHARWPDEVA